jgi:hypothetical protein
MNKWQRDHKPEAGEVKRGLRWDLLGPLLASVISIVLIFVLDTGSLAEWVAKHRESKIDEVIVVSAVLLLGVSFISIRRTFEVFTQVIKHDELHRETIRPSRESTVLGELNELLQSCLTSEEAYDLITDRAKVLFPGTSGALCVAANSRDLVEVVLPGEYQL